MKKQKPRCGARRKYDNQPCQAGALASGRCKLHGGMSTGPRSIEGKIRSLANLWPFGDCRVEILKIADIVESGKIKQDIFDRLIESRAPYSDRAVRKIAAWVMDDLQQEHSIQESRYG